MGRVSLTIMAVVMMIITIVSSNTNHFRAATLVKAAGNATYGCKGGSLGGCLAIADDMSLEFMFETNVARLLLPAGLTPKTDKTKNPNSQACSNGGNGNPSGTNPNGVCGNPPKATRNCPKYQNNKPCPP